MIFIVSLGMQRPIPFIGVQSVWPLVMKHAGNHITAQGEGFIYL
jgi:hypothetical protein